MYLDDFEFDEVMIKDVVVLDTSITNFNEGVFGKSNLKKDLYHHFGSVVESSRVRKALKVEGGSNEELMVNFLIKVNLYM